MEILFYVVLVLVVLITIAKVTDRSNKDPRELNDNELPRYMAQMERKALLSQKAGKWAEEERYSERARALQSEIGRRRTGHTDQEMEAMGQQIQMLAQCAQSLSNRHGISMQDAMTKVTEKHGELVQKGIDKGYDPDKATAKAGVQLKRLVQKE